MKHSVLTVLINSRSDSWETIFSLVFATSVSSSSMSSQNSFLSVWGSSLVDVVDVDGTNGADVVDVEGTNGADLVDVEGTNGADLVDEDGVDVDGADVDGADMDGADIDDSYVKLNINIKYKNLNHF